MINASLLAGSHVVLRRVGENGAQYDIFGENYHNVKRLLQFITEYVHRQVAGALPRVPRFVAASANA
jgi:hypothetical protein